MSILVSTLTWLAAALCALLLPSAIETLGIATPCAGSGEDQTATNEPDSALLNPLQRLVRALESLSSIGPQASLQETHAAVVAAARGALGTDLVALFTIDPCTAAMESESTPGVTDEIKAAALALYEAFLTEHQSRRTLRVPNVQEKRAENPAWHIALAGAGITSMTACPVHSDACGSGLLVALFRDRATIANDEAAILEGLSYQASAAISYALSMEQSRELVDGLAGDNMELSSQATSDGLTGLANHRTFQQTISDLCKKAARSTNRVFSLVMVDVDHFKIYNDTHGHREGDAVLRTVAKTLAFRLRQGDLAARYGGEEFAIILRDVGKEAARTAADRIRQAVCEHSLRKGTVTVSMGVSEFPGDGTTPGELIEHADKALYHAKSAGRNRVVMWDNTFPVEEASPTEIAKAAM